MAEDRGRIRKILKRCFIRNSFLELYTLLLDFKID
jgi:hypothetical protein